MYSIIQSLIWVLCLNSFASEIFKLKKILMNHSISIELIIASALLKIMKPVKRLLVTTFSLLVLLLLSWNISSAQSTDEHKKWIGTVEGYEVSKSGGGIVYDLTFNENGEVRVEKSTG